MRLLQFLDETLRTPRFFVEKISDTFWPSEAGIFVDVNGYVYREGGCSRKTYYRLTGASKVRSEDLGGRIVTQLGRDIQNVLTEVSKLGRIFLADEVPIRLSRLIGTEKVVVTGAIDILLQDPDTGRPFAVEVKSVGHWKAMDGLVQQNSSGVFAPLVEHTIQVMMYLDALRDMGVKNPEAKIVYIDRDKPRLQGEHVVTLGSGDHAVISNDVGVTEWSFLTLGNIYNDMALTASAVRAGVPPERNYQIQYDNQTIFARYQAGKFNKTDSKLIQKCVKDGSIHNQTPVIEAGDFACSVCEFKNLCYGGLLPPQSRGPFGKVELASDDRTKTPSSLTE